MRKQIVIANFTKSLVWLCLVSFLVGLLPPNLALGFELQERSLSLGSVVASATTKHTFSFRFKASHLVGSLSFEYCMSPVFQVSCVKPNGLNAAQATFDAQSGETFSTFAPTAGRIVIGRAPSMTGLQMNSYTFGHVTNPSSLGTFFVRISAYTSINGSGLAVDIGSVAASINQQVTITSEVPQMLIFCVAISIPGECATAVGDFLQLGNLSTSSTSAGISQFLVSTNAPFGYFVRFFGNTMTSGNDTIKALSTPTASFIGVSQFGTNLRANTVPPIGKNPQTSFGGTVAPDYNIVNKYKFNSSDILASNTFVGIDEKYTVSYIVNVDSSQPIGVYNTTITYIVTASF